MATVICVSSTGRRRVNNRRLIAKQITSNRLERLSQTAGAKTLATAVLKPVRLVTHTQRTAMQKAQARYPIKSLFRGLRNCADKSLKISSIISGIVFSRYGIGKTVRFPINRFSRFPRSHLTRVFPQGWKSLQVCHYSLQQHRTHLPSAFEDGACRACIHPHLHLGK